MSWQEQAACRGKPTDWWFPNVAGKHRNNRVRIDPRALELCAVCPVRADCSAAGVGWVGIWGGQVNTMTGYVPQDPATGTPRSWCGTTAGYARHRRAGERPCPACTEANTAYHRVRRGA
jgi:hypothetical protein